MSYFLLTTRVLCLAGAAVLRTFSWITRNTAAATAGTAEIMADFLLGFHANMNAPLLLQFHDPSRPYPATYQI